jgi:hypothetical protein
MAASASDGLFWRYQILAAIMCILGLQIFSVLVDHDGTFLLNWGNETPHKVSVA